MRFVQMGGEACLVQLAEDGFEVMGYGGVGDDDV